jgi:hypothetical protein
MQLVDDGGPLDVANRKKLPEIIVVAHDHSDLMNTQCSLDFVKQLATTIQFNLPTKLSSLVVFS